MTPEAARELWSHAIKEAEDNPASVYHLVLQHVELSVLVDIIDARMAKSDTFAVTIGTRMAFLKKAIEAQS